jgi:hypothetical protein
MRPRLANAGSSRGGDPAYPAPNQQNHERGNNQLLQTPQINETSNWDARKETKNKDQPIDHVIRNITRSIPLPRV